MDAMIRGLAFSVYSLSIVCGMLVVLMIVVGGVVNRALVDRVSLRLTLAISVVDVAKSIVLILYMYMDQDTFTCSLVSFFIQWFTLVYLFLNSSILFNIQLIYFHGISSKRSLEHGYWIFCFLFPTLLLVPPLVAGRLGYDERTGGCEYKDPSSKASNVWLWCCFTFWVMAACVYSVTTAMYTLPRSSSLASRMTNRSSYPQDNNYHCYVSRLIKRLSMICLIPIFTQIYMIITAVKFYCGIHMSSFDKILATISIGSPGILNLIAFLLDPAFKNIIDSLSATNSTLCVEKVSWPSQPTFAPEPILSSSNQRSMSSPHDIPQTAKAFPSAMETIQEEAFFEESPKQTEAICACFYLTDLVRGL